MAELGILLEARAVHTSRSAFHHLLALAQTNNIARSRVDEVIELVGLDEVARKRAGGFSLGMGQRLGVATALLGDPRCLVLDEPVNGLDPEGVLWIRNLLRGHAARGNTVFVSSHLMSEMALTADRLIVVGRGRLIADTTVDDLINRVSSNVLSVTTPDAGRLAEQLRGPDVSVTSSVNGTLEVTGVTAEQLGDIAFENNIRLYGLVTKQPSLEDAFMELTAAAVEYHAHDRGDQGSHGAVASATISTNGE